MPVETQVYEFEIVPVDEQKKIEDIAQKTIVLQDRRATVFKDIQNGKKLRGVHPKSHGCLVAEFEINRSIPDDLQVGLFSNPGKRYKALIRYSNASVRLSPDLENNQNASRGMAIKVFDVGERVEMKDQGHKHQDFLMINTRAFAFPNVRSYQRLTDALIESDSGADPTAAFSPAADWTAEDFPDPPRAAPESGDLRRQPGRPAAGRRGPLPGRTPGGLAGLRGFLCGGEGSLPSSISRGKTSALLL